MSLFSIRPSLSGIHAAATRMVVSARNVSRMNVPDAAKQRTIDVAAFPDGVASVVQEVPPPEGFKGQGPWLSTNIDYAEEAVQQLLAKTSFGANVRAAQYMVDMEDAILDITV